MTAQRTMRLRLPDYASFENFLPAANSDTVLLLREFLSNDDGRGVAYLWGESGTGKTHLLYAACRTADPSAYLSLQDRTIQPDIIDSLDDQVLICIDDFQCAVGRIDWEKRLMAMVDSVESEPRRLLVSANLAPEALDLALPDLASRFSGRQLLRLRPISDDDRVAIFVDRASRRGMEIEEKVARYAINRYTRDLHHVLELLDRIEQLSLEKHRRITVPLLKQLEDLPA